MKNSVEVRSFEVDRHNSLLPLNRRADHLRRPYRPRGGGLRRQSDLRRRLKHRSAVLNFERDIHDRFGSTQ